MYMNDLISVIMPYWKYSIESVKYLEESLQSLEDQVYKNFELILCIDSPRHINDVREVENLIEKFNFKIIMKLRKSSSPNISLTRNYALEFASGDWIAFLDADNIWHKEWLAYMIDTARKVHPDAVYSRAAPDKSPLKHSGELLEEWCNYDIDFDIINENHFHHYINSPADPLFGSVMISKEQLNKIGMFDPELEIYETSLMMVKLFMNYRIYFVKKAFLYTRIWGGAISQRGGHKNLVKYKSLFHKKSEDYYNKMLEED